jgi:NAD+ diphosphatase
MLNNSLFKFCPRCGSKEISAPSENSMICDDCNYMFYHNTAAATAAILLFEGKIIFTRRGKNPGIGMLDLPGGFIDYNESAETGVLREISEETGFVVKNLKYFGSMNNQYLYREVLYHTCDLVFTGEVDSIVSFRPSEEIRELVLLKPNEVNLKDMAFDSLRNMVSKYVMNNE